MATLYLKVAQSQCFHKKVLTVKDIASIYCTDPDIKHGAEQIPIIYFEHYPNDKKVLSVLKIVEEIEKKYPDTMIMNMGELDCILYYKAAKTEKKWVRYCKIASICLVGFFGSAFSIMAYNTDISADTLFDQIYNLVIGKPAQGPGILQLTYSIGLAIGVIVFFNHVAKKRLSDDPTPFEVQMRMYEKNVNDTFIIGADRKEELIDVD
ncbi:MAG: stage V sporulation protein AA [Lachnospiraceae bacterium]